MANKEKFYEKNWFMWVTLILFAPVGIFLMWKYKRFGKVPRVVLSCVFAICFLVVLGTNQSNTHNVVNQTQAKVNHETAINKKLAADLDSRIVKLGDTNSITLGQSADVKAIRLSYDKSTTEEKKDITKLTLLTSAEKKISGLQSAADKAVADKVAADKVAADKVAADKIVSDKAAADKVAATSSSSTVQGQNNEYTVYITKTGNKYHRAGCRYLSRSQIAISKSDAIGSGFTPCSVCNP